MTAPARSGSIARGSVARYVVLAVSALVVALYLAVSNHYGLNADVRYVLGGFAASDGGLGGSVDTFVHRPLAYRLPMAALHELILGLGIPFDDLVAYETAVRIGAILVCCGAGLWLWAALRNTLGNAEAVAVSVASSFSLALAPTWDFLQGEWVATLCIGLAVASGISLRPTWLAGAASGAFLVIAVAVKLATAPLLPVGILLLALIDMRRAAAAAFGALAWTIAWALTLTQLPVEWQWTLDMAALSPNSLLRGMPDGEDVAEVLAALMSKAALSPWIVMTPAAVIVLVRSCPRQRQWWILAATGGALVLSVMPFVVQGSGWLYHLSAVPVVSAALVGMALVRARSVVGAAAPYAAIMLAVLGLAATALLAAPAETREQHARVIAFGMLLVAVLVAIGASITPPGPRRGGPAHHPMLAGLLPVACLLLLLPALAPASAWTLHPSLSPASGATNADWARNWREQRSSFRVLSERIGRQTPVLYFAWGGDVVYHMGNPTDCRYPSPLWLYGSTNLAYVQRFASYRDNLRCITATHADYLVLDPNWLDVDRLETSARLLVEGTFDCTAALAEERGVVICPRRTGATGEP